MKLGFRSGLLAAAITAAICLAVGPPAEASPRPTVEQKLTAQMPAENSPMLAMGAAAVAAGAMVAGPVVRAKFRLTEERSHAHTQAKTLCFSPIYDTSIPEDRRFAEATPSGELKMYVNNPAALEKLKLGRDYYLDFAEAPRVFRDGDQWCALVGDDLQSGLAAFGATPDEALQAWQDTHGG